MKKSFNEGADTGVRPYKSIFFLPCVRCVPWFLLFPCACASVWEFFFFASLRLCVELLPVSSNSVFSNLTMNFYCAQPMGKMCEKRRTPGTIAVVGSRRMSQ